MSKPLMFLDTETTGLGNSRLVELALSTPSEGMTFRCAPPIPIEFGAMAVHHITEEDVAHLPRFNKMPVYKKVQEFLDTHIMVAHNAEFDIGVLEREGLRVSEYICTKNTARSIIPEAENHQLQYLRYFLGVKVKGEAHSASGDIAVLEGVWNALVSRFNAEDEEKIKLHFTRTR